MCCEPKDQELNTFICSIYFVNFLTPLGPLGCVHIDLDKNSVTSGCVGRGYHSIPKFWLISSPYLNWGGGHIMLTALLRAPPPDFQTLRRPCKYMYVIVVTKRKKGEF